MSFINPYNQTGVLGATGYDRPRWSIPTQPSYTPSAGGYSSGYYDAGSPGSLASLASNVTGINIAGQQAANSARIPNAPGLEAQSSKMIEDQLLGKIPADVLALLGQGAGERAVAGGMVGAPASEAAYRRALGLTSIGQQESGQRNLSAAYARNPGAKVMDAESQIITPYQQAQLDLERQRLALASRGSGGGGGGGGGYPRTSGTGTEGGGGYIPSDVLFGTGRRGTMYSPDQSGWTPSTVGQAATNQGNTFGGESNYGYQPVSSGEMFIGDPFDYYTGGGWMDDFFGNYGG